MIMLILVTEMVFSIAHFNCRSLKRNFENMSKFLKCFTHTFSLIGLTDTWLTNTETPLLGLPNYIFITNNRQNKCGGGVGIYLNNDLKFKRREDLEILNDCVETICAEMYFHNRNVVIIVVYRPPSKPLSTFLEGVELIMHKILNEKKECYFLGDFNVDLLSPSPSVSTFVDLFTPYSFLPVISKPTRITPHSATLLDNIFTNESDNVI